MNILIVIIFVALIIFIFEQRRHIKYLKTCLVNRDNIEAMNDHKLELIEGKNHMLELTLNTLGYDIKRFSKGDFIRKEPSQDKLQEIWEEYQKLQSISRSQSIAFDVEMELRETD